MLNRRLFIGLGAALSGLSLAGKSSKATAATDKKHKVAYHVSDRNKVGFVLRNIRNHIKGVGGIDNVDLILVAHGPALKEFNTIEGTSKVQDMVSSLMGEGVQFNACGNTMRALKYDMDELVDGMIRVDQGGVVRLAELQEAGYMYIRP